MLQTNSVSQERCGSSAAANPEGLLLINKPSGVTSHDVVQVVRRKLSLQRVGHTGTLDPMAQGLLLVLVGRATKVQQAFQAHEKTYEATLQLGVQTNTGDTTGAPVQTAEVPRITADQLRDVLTSFEGALEQTPPAYSAVKVRGRPAYWWARRRQAVTLSSRLIHLTRLSLVRWEMTNFTFRVDCSHGTYIRTLAESIAQRLGTVGHLTQLIRLRVGSWRLEEAKALDWMTHAEYDTVVRELLPVTPLTLAR